MLKELYQNVLVYELQQLYYPNRGLMGPILTESHLKSLVMQELQLEDFKENALASIRQANRHKSYLSLGFLYSTIPQTTFDRITTFLGRTGDITTKNHNYFANCNIDGEDWKIKALRYGNRTLHFQANPIYSQNQK